MARLVYGGSSPAVPRPPKQPADPWEQLTRGSAGSTAFRFNGAAQSPYRQPTYQPTNQMPYQQPGTTRLRFGGAVQPQDNRPAWMRAVNNFMNNVGTGISNAAQGYNQWVQRQNRNLQRAGRYVQNATPQQRTAAIAGFFSNPSGIDPYNAAQRFNARAERQRMAANPNPEMRYFQNWPNQNTTFEQRNPEYRYMQPYYIPDYRARAAYAARLAGQAVDYYSKPVIPMAPFGEEPTYVPPQTGGGGGWGYYPVYGGGGGGGGTREAVDRFWNNMVHWSIRPSGNRGG